MPDPKNYKKSVSLSGIIDRVQQAFYRNGENKISKPSLATESDMWVCEVYDTHIVAEYSQKYYEIGYREESGEIVFDPMTEWVEVERKTEWAEKKSASVEESGLKIGAQFSRKNKDVLRQIRELVSQLEIDDAEPEKEQKTADANNNLKAISSTDDELRVGNYIVLFGGRDLTGFVHGKNADGSSGEFFSKSVDVESEYTKSGVLHVDFEHSLDPDGLGIGKDDVLGYVDWKTATRDDKGIFVERVLNRRNKYVKWLEELIGVGMVGTSSESIKEDVEKKSNGEIVRWPLRRDTLTVSPMEPRMLSANAVTALKAIGIDIEDEPEPQQETEHPEPQKIDYQEIGRKVGRSLAEHLKTRLTAG